MLRFATWLALCLMAGCAWGAVIHVFPKFGAVYNPDQTLADPTVIAAVDPLASLDLAPTYSPLSV